MAEEKTELIEIQSYGVKMPDGKTKVFTDKSDALAQVMRNAVESKIRKYTEAKGLTDKVANTRINVIVDYLAWEEAGCPGPALPEESDAPEAGADGENSENDEGYEG